MAHRLFDRAEFAAHVAEALNDPGEVQATMAGTPLPKPLATWLARLRLLKGVPFNYLVPDEAMLPPESIRFFTLDQGWIDTLVDGAMSIGRNLSTDPNPPLAALEASVAPHSTPAVTAETPMMRAKALGLAAPPVTLTNVTGFLMRSRVVSTYAGMGVNVFPKGHTPADKAKNPATEIILLDILRFETLGDQSDTLLCLVDGDAYRVDIHEAPEELHYGIDSYAEQGGQVTASKNIHTFSKSGDNVTIEDKIVTLDLDDTFRPGGRRVMKMTDLAGQIVTANPPITQLDAAEMGFVMTEGVGMVSFIKGPKT